MVPAAAAGPTAIRSNGGRQSTLDQVQDLQLLEIGAQVGRCHAQHAADLLRRAPPGGHSFEHPLVCLRLASDYIADQKKWIATKHAGAPHEKASDVGT